MLERNDVNYYVDIAVIFCRSQRTTGTGRATLTNVWMTESDAEVQSNSDSSSEEDNIDSTPDDSITDVDLDPEKGNN